MEEVTRRLATIVMADVVGYSRLMGADERGTHHRVQAVLHELIEPTIKEHRGRLVKQRGDGFLSMFDSPVEAVRCAIVIQQSMVSRNLELPNDQAIRLRIGINLGDVIVEPDDIYGEGVNVAARLEQLAGPGNIYISGGVYEQVRYKLVCGYQSLGDKKVKNIQDPIATYRVLPDPASIQKANRRNRNIMIYRALGTMGVGIGIGLVALFYYARPALMELVGVSSSAPQQQPEYTPPAKPIVAAEAPKPVPAIVTPPPTPEAPPRPKPPVIQAENPTPSPPKPEPPAQVIPTPITPPPAQPTPPMQEAAIVVPALPKIESPPPITPPPSRPAPPARSAIAEPEMVTIPGGVFQMGSADDPTEQPIHRVTVKPFLLAKYPVTVRQWLDCVEVNACTYIPADSGADAPINNVSWNDAQQYVKWLSKATNQHYRLPSEAEWEYAARGRTDTKFWWGNTVKPGMANCKGCGDTAALPTKIGTRAANPFGLFDINGGVSEWVEDCWVKNYKDAPADSTPRVVPNCRDHVLRGAAWNNDPNYVRSASRDFYDASVRYPTHGLRVARDPN